MELDQNVNPVKQPAAVPADHGAESPEAMIPKSEAQKAFAARDAAKAGYKLIAKQLGLDPESVKIFPTGDPKNPYAIEVPGLEIIGNAARALREGRQLNLDEAQMETIKNANEESAKTISAYEKFVERVSVESELRAAFAQSAIDTTGDGTYADLIALTRGRIKAERGIDPVTGELTVQITALDSKGQPMTDAAGSPLGVKKVVDEFLKTRPALQKTKPGRGPGAGGYGSGTAQAGGKILANADRGHAAADMMFGKAGPIRR